MDDLVEYLKRLMRSGGLWGVAIADGALISLDAFGPAPDLDSVAYMGIGALAIFVGGFRIFQEDRLKREFLSSRLMEALQDQPRPQLTIKPVPGDEYSFELTDGGGDTPDAIVEVHMRLRNCDKEKELRILSITPVVTIEDYEGGRTTRWEVNFENPVQVLGKDGNLIEVVHRLGPQKDLKIRLRGRARPASGFNPAQYAKKMGAEDTEGVPSLRVVVKVDYVGAPDSKDWQTVGIVVLEPTELDELYVERWRTNDKTDLLELAKRN